MKSLRVLETAGELYDHLLNDKMFLSYKDPNAPGSTLFLNLTNVVEVTKIGDDVTNVLIDDKGKPTSVAVYLPFTKVLFSVARARITAKRDDVLVAIPAGE